MASSPSTAKAQASSTAATKRITRSTRLALEKKFAAVTAQIDQELESSDDVTIDCFYNADGPTSQLNKDDEYAHLLRLRSEQPFSLVKSIVLKDGEYEGHVALIMKQAFPFAFMKLSMDIRKRVYQHLFEPEENVVRIKTKTGGQKLPHAPGYNSHNRAAIVAVSSEVRMEALPVLLAMGASTSRT
ncbi:hypothetical protein AOQ84DRAFT_75249 [Glonium stellatum]|uniref:Uncharacterized protein n=1 Tax=Glonium stellatum TaxID=574774 RepID=A0A8E2EXV8_9PEZI|nr:hypothetical protein AOQ84DRAFT_75249 [Glonium stellatum]